MSNRSEPTPVPSQFTYPRSVVDDVATVICSFRHRVEPEFYPALDRLIEDLADEFARFYPGFDVDRFINRSHRNRDT